MLSQESKFIKLTSFCLQSAYIALANFRIERVILPEESDRKNVKNLK